MRAYERLLRYAQFDTASCKDSSTVPSTPGQKMLSQALVDELIAMGVTDARMDDKGYVYASIPANAQGQPAIGLIAHVDTVDSVPVLPMNARVVEFDGQDVPLNDQGGVLSMTACPYIKKYKGQHLMVTDGLTLLGADDKAGVAEIMTLCQRLMENPSIPHGKVCIAFTPDEEIGRGADHFDVKGFGADFAYTVDGGELGEIEYENFNAANGIVTVNGVSIHTGGAKDRMKNAVKIAAEFINLLPAAQAPEHTQLYEGFFHVDEIQGSVEKATMFLLVRDHDREKFEKRKEMVHAICRLLNEKYGPGTVELDLKDSYYNMAGMLKDRMDIVDRAKKAMEDNGIKPLVGPIRGGTDGSRLSYMGLLCPNLSTGGMNFHGRYECIPVESMDAMVEVLTSLIRAR